MMQRPVLFLIMLLCTAAFAQDLPRIAVYVTGDVPENEKKALGTRMLSSLVKSGRYKGIERSNSFLAELEKEQTKQRSGAIDDSQISELGKQFGIKFVCIADITPVFGSYQVSARIVDVETAEVALIGEAFSPLKTADDLIDVSDKVVRSLFGELTVPEPKPEPKPEPAEKQAIRIPEQPAPAPQPVATPSGPPKSSPKPMFWVGIGLDVLGAGVIAYGVYENENVKSRVDGRVYSEAEKSAQIRNVAYAAGAAALLAGISFHIFF